MVALLERYQAAGGGASMDPDVSTRRFGALLVEWNELLGRERQVVLGEWTETMARMTGEEVALRRVGRWVRGPSDIFGVLGISRAEVRHTRLIAWLMDPAGRHGLGVGFLQRVLARAFPEERFEGLDRASPACEVVRADCRADIVVWGPSFTIVIEAKVDAIEGPEQCAYQYLQFSDEPGSRFIFLSPRGRLPETATGEAEGAFRSVSFGALREDLRNALEGGAPATGRGAAEDYLRTLEREFP
jgi:hypothetical protein